MKIITLILTMTVLLTYPIQIQAQSNTGKKIETVGNDVQKADDAIEKGKSLINNLFKKKKKKQNDKTFQEGELVPNIVNEGKNTAANVNTPDIKPQHLSKLKPGDVHPDAVVLDVDGMEPYNSGAARVVKGNASALIDRKGGFLIPFNQFMFMPQYGNRSQNGIFITSSAEPDSNDAQNNLGFVNSDGKVITLQKPFVGLGQDIGEYFLVNMMGGGDPKSYLYDNTGKMFSITNLITDTQHDLASWGYRQLGPLFLYRGQNSKYGFRDKNDKIMVQAQWDEAHNFSDGAALVGKKNEFGEIKYGFIDTSGKIIVPLTYSNKPNDFSDGLAKVFSNEKIDNSSWYYYGYIDKSGELVIDSKNFEVPSMLFSSFYHGYAFNYKYVLNKKGHIVLSNDFLMDHGIPEEIIGKNEIVYNQKNVSNGKMLVNFKGDQTDRRKQYFALLDLINKKTLFYWYADVSIDYFDPVSELAHVIVYGDKARADIKREGYINEDGVFMIVKGEGSKW